MAENNSKKRLVKDTLETNRAKRFRERAIIVKVGRQLSFQTKVVPRV